jgi:hypothetical protein
MRGGLTASDLIMFLYLLKFLLGSMIKFRSERSSEYLSGTLSQVCFSLETAVWFKPARDYREHGVVILGFFTLIGYFQDVLHHPHSLGYVRLSHYF